MIPLKKSRLCCCNFDLTRREWLVLAAVTSVCFASGVCISMQGPIYPKEAEKKGAKASEYGMVFGVFELVNFILCPIYGKYMNYLGARNLITGGIILAGVTYILFGFVDLIPSHLDFIILSFTLRIMEAVGISAAFTASFTVVITVFTKNVATMLAITECFFGFGYTIGPTIGGYLFQVGGFEFPFILVGSLLLIDAVFIIFTLPKIGTDNDKYKLQANISSVLKLRPVILDLISVLVIHLSIGYYLATLEPHLRQFSLSPLHVGLIFGIEAGIYMLSTPLVGIICDTRVISPKLMMILGFLLCITSFALVGPLPFVPIKGALWMVYLGMVLHGIGMSCVMVPGFIDAIHSAVRGGLADDVTTYSLVTGMSTSAVALGAFIGPSVAGFLFDNVGFRLGTLFVIVIYTVLLVAMTIFVCTEGSNLPKSCSLLSRHEDNYSELTDESAPITNPTKGKEYGTNEGQNDEEEEEQEEGTTKK